MSEYIQLYSCWDWNSGVNVLKTRCYCGNTLAFESQKVDDARCRNICIANFSQICGGSGLLSLYQADDEWETAIS